MYLHITLDLSYCRKNEVVWEGEGQCDGKVRWKQRVHLGMQMSRSARGLSIPSCSRFQPWETPKIWSYSEDWTYSCFRHFLFSHRSCSRGLQGRKRQERAQPCLHGPIWWKRTATTPWLSFTHHHWNPSVRQSLLTGLAWPDRSWGAHEGLSPAKKSLWWSLGCSGFPSPPPRIRPEQTAQCHGWLPNAIVDTSRTLKLKWQPWDQRSLEMNESPFASTAHIKTAERGPRAAEDSDHYLNVTHPDLCGEMKLCVYLSKAQLKKIGYRWGF